MQKLKKGFVTFGLIACSTMMVNSIANADTFVNLANGRKVATAPDGTKVVITSWNEHAIISPSISNNGLNRFAMVSDTVTADTNNAAAKGSLTLGYIIGCQFDVSSAQFSGSMAGDIGAVVYSVYPAPGALYWSPTFSLGLSANVPITPGQVNVVNIVQQPFSGGKAAVQLQDQRMTVQTPSSEDAPCAGYAQARSFKKVVVNDGTYTLTTTMYGQPFGL